MPCSRSRHLPVTDRGLQPGHKAREMAACDADKPWPEPAKKLHVDWWRARIDRQKEMDASIAARAEFESLMVATRASEAESPEPEPTMRADL